MAQGELRLLKRAPTAIEVGDLLLISSDADAEKKIRRALHGILGLEVARSPRAARAALESRRWIGCVVDLDHGGSDKLHALAMSRSGHALALFDTVDAHTRKYLDGIRSVVIKYKSWAHLVAMSVAEGVCGARDRHWIDAARAATLVEKVHVLRHRRNERKMARRLGVASRDLTWMDRLRACDWRGVPIHLQAEILAHGHAALPALLSMLDEEDVSRLWVGELAFLIGGRRVIGPLVRAAVETERGLPLPLLERICDQLGSIVAKPVIASLPRATPLGRFFAARMLCGLGVRDARIFQLLRREFEDPERSDHRRDRTLR